MSEHMLSARELHELQWPEERYRRKRLHLRMEFAILDEDGKFDEDSVVDNPELPTIPKVYDERKAALNKLTRLTEEYGGYDEEE